MERREWVTRKIRLGDGEESFSHDFWVTIPRDERFAEAWRLSEELWRFSGRDPGEPGLHRSVTRLVRR